MNETSSIRAAARFIRVPERHYSVNANVSYAAPTEPTAIEAAREFAGLAQRAARDTHSRLTGLKQLFSEEVAAPIFDALENVTEMFSESLHLHEQAHQAGREFVQRMRSDHEIALRTVSDHWTLANDMIVAAAADLDARRSRQRPDRRGDLPDWYIDAERAGIININADILDPDEPF